MTWKQLTENDRHEWKLNVQHLFPSIHAASQLPGKSDPNALW